MYELDFVFSIFHFCFLLLHFAGSPFYETPLYLWTPSYLLLSLDIHMHYIDTQKFGKSALLNLLQCSGEHFNALLGFLSLFSWFE